MWNLKLLSIFSFSYALIATLKSIGLSYILNDYFIHAYLKKNIMYWSIRKYGLTFLDMTSTAQATEAKVNK